MSIDNELDNPFHNEDINEIVADIVVHQPKLEGLIVLEKFKGVDDRDGDLRLLKSDGITMADVNLLLDIAKAGIIEYYTLGDFEEEEE